MKEYNDKDYLSANEKKREKKRKRRWRKVLFRLLLIIILALVFAYYLGFLEDFGFGSGTEFFKSNPDNHAVETPSEEEPKKDADGTLYYDIRIQGEMIYLNEEEISIDALEAELLGIAADDVVFNLIDNIAVDSVYKEVEAILKQNNLTYNTREDGSQ